jgi:hypothetical protein
MRTNAWMTKSAAGDIWPWDAATTCGKRVVCNQFDVQSDQQERIEWIALLHNIHFID